MRRIGDSFLFASLLFLPIAGAGRAQTRKEPPHGVVAGTVFRDPGFAVRGAKITMVSLPSPGEKALKEKTVSDDRGEFAFRVAPVEMHYKVSVQAKGFQPQEKEVEIRGEERVEANFVLEEASK